METRRWIVAGEYIKTTSAVAGCATFIIGKRDRRSFDKAGSKTKIYSLRLRRHPASHVPRLPARVCLLLLPRPPLHQLVAGPVQRVHCRDGAKAKAHAERKSILSGLRTAQEQDRGSRRARQEGGDEGAQVPRADCDRRFGSRIRSVANSLGQYIELSPRSQRL